MVDDAGEGARTRPQTAGRSRAEDAQGARIDALLAAGELANAAEACLAVGDAARAAELFARNWDDVRAVRVAREAGLWSDAYRHALAAHDPAVLASLLDALEADPHAASAAAAVAEGRGRPLDAGRLRRAAGDFTGAATAFEAALDWASAAACHEAAGNLRAAGRLWERRLAEAPDDGAAALALGQILLRFGRPDPAAKALQVARSAPDTRLPAMRLLVAAFAALGHDDAATSVLDVLRRDDASLPLLVPAFLERTFSDPRGPVGDAQRALLAGRYRVVRALGAGATGRVLLAEDTFYGHEVAVKVLAAPEGPSGRDALARFAREARVTASIEHPNVVRVHDLVPEGPFLVMEAMPGGTLEARLSTPPAPPSPLSPALARHVAASLLRALSAAHRRGVVHRDVKPANVFFGATGEVKLGDFGAAHLLEHGHTRTGAMVGTLATMAPEQLTGSARPSPATDLYALGVVLFRCLTGALPFPGPDFAAQHLGDPPPSTVASAPWLDPPIDALLGDLLEKDPARRPQDALDVLDRLEALPWSAWDDAFSARARTRDAPAPGPPAHGPPGLDPHPGDAPAPPSAVEPDAPTRYVEPPAAGLTPRIGGSAQATRIAFDTLLERPVELRGATAEARAALLRAASVRAPTLQAVLAIEAAPGLDTTRIIEESTRSEGAPHGPLGREAARVEWLVLERGRGLPLPPSRPLATSVVNAVSAALDALHGVGLVHGSVDADHVLLVPPLDGTHEAPSALLRLPERPAPTTATPDDDRAALARLALARPVPTRSAV